MTMRTSYKIVCECGHEGNMHMKENDQPFGKNWEHYSVSSFNGEGYQVTGASAEWETVFEKMKITCPECNAKITPKNMKTP